jgi:hypothetical protein
MRELSPEEADALGLNDASGITLSAADAAAAGLPVAPKPPPQRTPRAGSEVGAFGRGALKGASLHFDDKIGALMQAALATLDRDPETSFGDTYDQALSENKQIYAANAAAHPNATLAGEVTGTIASPANFAMPSAGALKQAGVTGPALARALAAQGAFIGGAHAAGASDATNVVDATLDVAKEAIPSAMAGATLSRFTPDVIPDVGQRGVVRDTANKAGLMALEARAPQIRQMMRAVDMDPSRVEEVAEEGLKRRIIPWFGGLDEAATRAQPHVDSEMQALHGVPADDGLPGIPGVLQKMDADGRTVNMHQFGRRMAGDLESASHSPADATRNVALSAGQQAHAAAQEGVVPFSRGHQLKADFQRSAYDLKDPAAEMLAPPLRKFIDEGAEKAGALGAEYLKRNENISKLLALQGAIEGRIPVQKGNNALPLTSYMAGSARYGETGDLGQAAAAAGVVKAVKERVPALVANTLTRLAEALEANPEVFGRFSNMLRQAQQRGPEALAAVHKQLMEQVPEYLDAWERQYAAEQVR